MSKESRAPLLAVHDSNSLNMTVCWQSRAPKYYSDLNTYIWQPFKFPPPFTYAKIFILNKDLARNPRVVLLFQQKSSLRSFRKKFHTGSEEPSDNSNWVPAKDLTRAIASIYSVAIADTLTFLEETSRDVHSLVRLLLSLPPRSRFCKRSKS